VVYEKLTRHYSHEIYGVLFHGIGVCEGIAKTVKTMLSRLGVESIVVLGDTAESGLRHAWNVVWLYGKPRHYDFTFDLSRHNGGKKPIYQNLTDEQIFRDHEPSVFPIPNCY
jgi:transglutaminase/protease-like cytokinesis protein 3